MGRGRPAGTKAGERVVVDKSKKVVVIPRDQFAAIRNIHPFRAAIGVIREIAAIGGVDLSEPFTTWMDPARNYCIQNVTEGRW